MSGQVRFPNRESKTENLGSSRQVGNGGSGSFANAFRFELINVLGPRLVVRDVQCREQGVVWVGCFACYHNFLVLRKGPADSECSGADTRLDICFHSRHLEFACQASWRGTPRGLNVYDALFDRIGTGSPSATWLGSKAIFT